MNNKIITALVIGGSVVVLLGGIYLFSQNNAGNGDNQDTNTNNTQNDDFQKMGQYSFGLDVCNEMTKEVVGEVIGKSVLTTTDYSNSTGTGCQYHTEPNDMGTVSVNVSFGEANKAKEGSEFLDRKVGTESSIGLENFTVFSSDYPTEIMDIYLVIDPMQKYVRVGRHSVEVVDNATLIGLAQRTEEKIRSYR